MSDETPKLAETVPAPNGEPIPGPTVDGTNVTTDHLLRPPRRRTDPPERRRVSATVEILVDRKAALDVLWSIDTALRGEAPVEESWVEIGEAIRSAVSLDEYEAHMGRPAVTA